MATESVATQNEVNDALARLCNAECMLEVLIDAHDETVVGGDEWKFNEALHGIRRLLDGIYCTLNDYAHSTMQDSEGSA